jgi:hypothetical protein
LSIWGVVVQTRRAGAERHRQGDTAGRVSCVRAGGG